MIAKGDNLPPPPPLGPLHQQALVISATATGDISEREELGAIAARATGVEQEMIGWLIENWIVRFGGLNILEPPA